MSVNLGVPNRSKAKLKPRVLVLGVGGGGCNALNTMIASGLKGVEFVACNTDAQSLEFCNATQKIQLGLENTEGLGAGSDPAIGKSAAEESYNDICEYIDGAHMAFIAAGMGGGTGTGAVSTIAKACKEKGILTVAVVTKPFSFEGKLRMDNAEKGIEELRNYVDTLIVIPNQNLYIVCDDKTSFAEAFCMADQVLHQGVRAVTDLMMQPGLINLDFADVRAVMSEMGRAVFGHGEAAGERRAIEAAESAISNPLLERVSLEGTKGLLLNITGGSDMSLIEATEAADRIKQEIDDNAKIIFGSSINKELDGLMRVSIIATGIGNVVDMPKPKNENSENKKKNETINHSSTNTIKPKFAEQTDLEDFTNQIVEIKKNTDENSLPKEQNSNDLQHNQQEKPSNVVLDFIKKLSPLKIFNFDKKEKKEFLDKKEENFLENDNLNIKPKEDNVEIADNPIEKVEQIIDEKKEIEEVITNDKEEKTEIKKEIKAEAIINKDAESTEKNEKKEEIKEKKTIQIQAEMPGLDDQNKESSDKKNTNDKEDLEIPSFLRNQSN